MIKYLDILFYFEWIIEMLYKWLKIDKKNDIRREKKEWYIILKWVFIYFVDFMVWLIYRGVFDGVFVFVDGRGIFFGFYVFGVFWLR